MRIASSSGSCCPGGRSARWPSADRPDDDAAEVVRTRVRALGRDRLLVFIAHEIAAPRADRRDGREIRHARRRVPLAQRGRVVVVDDRCVAERLVAVGKHAAVLIRPGHALPAIAVERAADAEPARRHARREIERHAGHDRRRRRRRGAGKCGVVPALPAVPRACHVVGHHVDAVEQRRDRAVPGIGRLEVGIDPADRHGHQHAGTIGAKLGRDSLEIGLIGIFERLPVKIEAVEAELIHDREQVRDERIAMERRRAAPAVDFAGAADHQDRLAAGRMRGVDGCLRPDRAVHIVDVEIVSDGAVGERPHAADHEVRQRAEIDRCDRIEIALVAHIVALDPARSVEAAREDRVAGRSGTGARTRERGCRESTTQDHRAHHDSPIPVTSTDAISGAAMTETLPQHAPDAPAD